IVGFGGVGRRLAELLSAFHTRIVATDMFPVDKPLYVDDLWPAERLDDLLRRVDIVVLALPLNDSTRSMVNASALAKMKRGALLVNVARGPLVVEADLVAALREEHLAGAALDVTDPEPLPAASPLWEMANVIITPHVGGQSAWRADNMTELF
ncbi:MAG: D-2-hydroxyacid dehydrogenase, partial [Planctomycetales bacterium]|nr:D-2-hydroxyacid dehydrogenase [Planctomycetales bacterium]